MSRFTEESLLESLKAKYAYLNDNDATALRVFNLITKK
jgi:hypothetical protein